MSYIIEPMPLISFLDESKLRLPRFQRKATWDKKQNFELAISVFQDYPVGVMIINQDQKTSWLLDGRQRRSALSLMRDNPVELYEWARSYINFKITDDEFDVRNKYWGKVDRYLQTEESKNNSEDDINQYENDDINCEEENSFDSEKQRKGLQTLLDIILMVHQNKPTGSKWEQTFDFKEYFPRLKYAPLKNNYKIEPKSLRRFLIELLKAIEQDNDGKCTKDFFIDYYLQNFNSSDQNNFEKTVSIRWENILNSLNVIDRSEKIFADARIGIIRLTNATPLDAQNIFSRINRGGTQLKAEELLSAKPYWNKTVNITNPYTISKINNMYNNLGIPMPESIVRWDIAATFISRIKDENLIFDSYEKNINDVSLDEISLGFKLLSSIYTQGMSNKHVNELEQKENIKWEYDIDELTQQINTICNILLSDTFFKFYQSWKKPITKLLGNAIALEFLTIRWLDWKERGCPSTVSGETKALQRDARVLFDKLIFEYATKTWRGSGDSKMSNDIKNWRSRLLHINSEDWKKFIIDACKGTYNGQPTTVKSLTPVLYYYYSIINLSPINQVNVSFDVDHIIPKERFVGNQIINQLYRDSLINLALLPKKDNISKKSKSLNEITDSWLKLQITTYTGISEKDFDTFSDISNIDKMYKLRNKIFINTFTCNRDTILSN